ncbi:hypothetical protein QFC21_003643 [Naganishia friedmannii]|uniref:Uncharacterized protein n=1 Tax=Naganishia friedmannii TaxID=89922 RepID=A0ACC2VMF0_9TREE|nr:hypothetical protein QFC21_003643 [Naganishia friedmannii]
MARGRIATPVDDEEEQQQQSQEDVDEDTESPRKRRRPNKGKAPASASEANGNGNGHGNASESEGEALTDDEEAVRAALRGWTLDSFTDKPIQLNKTVQQQMKKMQEQLHGQITLMSRSISRITDVAAALEDCRSGLRTKSSSSKSKSGSATKIVKRQVADSDEEVEAEEGGEQEGDGVPVQDDAEEKRNEETAIALDEKVKQLIDEIKVLECRIKALQAINAELQQNQEMVNIKGEVQRRFEKELGNYPQASDRTKYKNSEYYKTFKQTVWDIRHEDEACPPISSFLEKGPDDPESDDDDIEIGGTTQLTKCPLTLLPFEDAVTRYGLVSTVLPLWFSSDVEQQTDRLILFVRPISTKCPHSFSGEAIRNHISQSGRRSAKCPVAGCDKIISLSDIKPNPQLQKRSDKIKARLQRRREEEEEADAEDAELIE